MGMRARTRIGLAIALAGVGISIGAGAPGSALAGCSGSGDPTAELGKKTARDAVACLFNKERNAKNVKRNKDLEKAAQSHTEYMRSNKCFEHQCPGELSLEGRVKRTGYSSSPYVGEVLVAYPALATPQDIVKAWMKSPDHRDVILGRSFKDVGIGLSVRDETVLYTAVLGHK